MVQDEKHFLWFLKSLSSLRSLELSFSKFSQEFYAQLPALTISHLKLELPENSPKLNFDFIGQLSRLSYFFIIKQLCFESVTTLIRSIDKLGKGSFAFLMKEKGYQIKKLKIDKLSNYEVCELTAVQEAVFEAESSDEVLAFFEMLHHKDFRELPWQSGKFYRDQSKP